MHTVVRVDRSAARSLSFVGRPDTYLTSNLFLVLQVKMLQALGLKSTLITDGSSPINLFTTANGLLGALPGQGQ